MKWFYLGSWAIFLVGMAIASNLHDKQLESGITKERKGFWEMLWYGGACIAISDFFDVIFD